MQCHLPGCQSTPESLRNTRMCLGVCIYVSRGVIVCTSSVVFVERVVVVVVVVAVIVVRYNDGK